MHTPHEIKMDFERLLQSLGPNVPVITGIHSVVVEPDRVHVAYDIDGRDMPLDYDFCWPVEQVARHEAREFAEWLAAPNYWETVH